MNFINQYEKRILLVSIIMIISIGLAQQIMQYPLPSLAYVAVMYNLLVFSVIHRFIENHNGDANKSIRRVMIGSMLRLFLSVIFLAISLFNLGKVDIGFVVVYIFSFILFLFFEISKISSKLRPDSQEVKK